MSLGLVVLAIDPDADDEPVRAMVRRCGSGMHVEGEPDERIARFYEGLRARYPDFPPYDEASPWMSMPLDVGIDHVSMLLSYARRSDPVLRLIDELARRYELTIYDPQGDEIISPHDVRVPLDPTLAALMESLEASES